VTVPFRALDDGVIVVPAQIEDGRAVECPECRGVLYPRDGEHRARHFFHAGDEATESCSAAIGGESDTHARCTALAVDALTRQFPDAAQVGAEITIDSARTATTPKTRRADALVQFQNENPYFGTGLIIEVQHKHHSKDIEGTTHDYLSAGYSVVWLTPGDFEEEHLPYSVVDDAFRDDDEQAYSVREHEPREFETRVGANLEWEKSTEGCPMVERFDSHSWTRIPGYAHPNGYEYEFCWWCETRRQYDHELTRFVYDYEGVLAPETRPETLRDAMVLDPKNNEGFEEWKSAPFHSESAAFERALANRSDVAPCRGPRGIHEWDRGEVIERDFKDRVEVALWECYHCPVYLLTNFSGHGETEPYILFGKPPDPDWGLSGLNGNPRFCRNRSHRDESDWDYCPDCFQLDP